MRPLTVEKTSETLIIAEESLETVDLQGSTVLLPFRLPWP